MRERTQQRHNRRIRGTVAQGRDRGDARVQALGVVGGDAAQQSLRDTAGYEADGFDEAGASIRFSGAQQGALQEQTNLVGSRGTPLLEGALGEHSGETTAANEGDQSRYRVISG